MTVPHVMKMGSIQQTPKLQSSKSAGEASSFGQDIPSAVGLHEHGAQSNQKDKSCATKSVQDSGDQFHSFR